MPIGDAEDMRKRIMNAALNELLEAASQIEMTPADDEAQRRSFVYGNTRIENSAITRELVDEVFEEMKLTRG